jgi:hypothetical protein
MDVIGARVKLEAKKFKVPPPCFRPPLSPSPLPPSLLLNPTP